MKLKTNGMEVLDAIVYEEEMGFGKYNDISKEKIAFLLTKLGGKLSYLDILTTPYDGYFTKFLMNKMDYKSAAVELGMPHTDFHRILRKCQKHLQIHYVRNYYYNESSSEYKSVRYDAIFHSNISEQLATTYYNSQIEKFELSNSRTLINNSIRMEMKSWLLELASNDNIRETIVTLQEKINEERLSRMDIETMPGKKRARVGRPCGDSPYRTLYEIITINALDSIYRLPEGVKLGDHVITPSLVKSRLTDMADSLRELTIPYSEADFDNIKDYVMRCSNRLNQIYGNVYTRSIVAA